ncbi:hypothetical protein HPB47_017892 [Ixodes persulcatus]|uniref:Uncharacterized protein n=1 Tax=Ixodes persulcatus TaxID=34615 RepID=A0AC60QMY3_IXOPE|nr:hypothetical protein HPB47_017892 [Ixodes persulcatus]
MRFGVVVSCSALFAVVVLVTLPRDSAADGGGLLKYIACLQKLSGSGGACGKKKHELSVVEQAFGTKENHHSHHHSKDKKGLCCKFSGYVDCYLKHVRHSCGEAAGKYALKFIEMTTQKYVRNTCHKFDSRKCSAAIAPAASGGLLVSGVAAAILAFTLSL